MNDDNHNNNFLMTTNMNESPAKRRCITFEMEQDKNVNANDPPRIAPSTIAFNLITDAVETHPAPIKSLCSSIFQKYTALKNKE